MNWLMNLFRLQEAVEPASEWELKATLSQAVPVPVYTRYSFSDPSVRIAAVGDLHGRIDLLKQLASRLDDLANDPSRKLIEVYLGDFVDRAGDSKAVVEFLSNRLAKANHDVICLAGNHEQMLLAALNDDQSFKSWLNFGGQSTLASYGISPKDAKTGLGAKRAAFRAALPDAHLTFLKSLKLSYANGGFFFAHAGVRPGKPLVDQSDRDLLWIRDGFLKSNVDFGAVVVHGHTPVTRPEFKLNRIGIDTGAYYSGNLTCLTITSDEVSILDNKRQS